MHTFDLVVIGAGIHGAGFSYIASHMGLRCLLIEKSAAVGLATSSNSSKLIHGGLRYLESGQIHLVRECLIERARLLKAAADIVSLKPFFIPVYKNSRRSNCTIALGLSLYQLLGGKGFKSLPRALWPNFPIKQTQLTGLWQYWDCQTNDKLLTQRVAAAAEQAGCQIALNCTPIAIEINKPQSQQPRFNLTLSTGIQVNSHCLINASGPWANEVAELNSQLPKLPMQFVQGSHLVLNRPAFEGCFYLQSPIDGRPFFVLPWQGKQLLGTTETPINAPTDAQITQAETDYLLASYNFYLPDKMVGREDICGTFCGVRVLPGTLEDQLAINRATRETQFITSSEIPGYLALYGGKLTSFYATALKGIKLLPPLLSQHANHPLPPVNQGLISQPKF